nr:immunoglobulin light chain junction region [Macaca mulatta]MOY07436.1 immunoglobulin light chain junction region [Macaca mulatta]
DYYCQSYDSSLSMLF